MAASVGALFETAIRTSNLNVTISLVVGSKRQGFSDTDLCWAATSVADCSAAREKRSQEPMNYKALAATRPI
jgi:hypothetical protein